MEHNMNECGMCDRHISMEWWGIRVQWNGSLMGGEILRSGGVW